MKKIGSYFLALSLLFCLTLLFPSCAKREKVLTDQDLYNEAAGYLNEKKFRKAGEILEQLKEEYPESPLMARTRLNRADCYFELEEYDSARTEYESFLNFHPLHPKADFARFRIGMTYFKQILSSDRDQTFTMKAEEAFERFIKEYPQSEFLPEAKEKLSECRLRLIEKDLYVAQFYLKSGSFKAARVRLQKIRTLYPDVPRRDEVLYLLFQSYKMDGMNDEAMYVLNALCKGFPDSPFTKQIKDLCSDIEQKSLQ